MQVKLTRRWGPHRAPKTVEVSDSQGLWLIQHGYAESSGEVQAPEQDASTASGSGSPASGEPSPASGSGAEDDGGKRPARRRKAES